MIAFVMSTAIERPHSKTHIYLTFYMYVVYFYSSTYVNFTSHLNARASRRTASLLERRRRAGAPPGFNVSLTLSLRVRLSVTLSHHHNAREMLRKYALLGVFLSHRTIPPIARHPEHLAFGQEIEHLLE